MLSYLCGELSDETAEMENESATGMMIGVATSALIGLAAVLYAHWKLPQHSPNRRQLWLSRAILLFTGAPFAAVMGHWYWIQFGVWPLSGFMAGFGLVHIPAAIILALKTWRLHQS